MTHANPAESTRRKIALSLLAAGVLVAPPGRADPGLNSTSPPVFESPFTSRNFDRWAEVLTAGDFDADGIDDLMIGDPHYASRNPDGPDGGARSGLRGAAAWQLRPTSTAIVNAVDAEAGFALVFCDFDGDGRDDLAVGEPGWVVSGKADAGQVQEFHASTTGFLGLRQNWNQDVSGVLSTAEAGERFGHALACGDFNGDGRGDLAIGVPGTLLSGNANAGAIHILFGSASGLTAAGDIHLGEDILPTVAAELNDEFGSVLAAGDLNGDGFDDLAVGTPLEDVTGHTDAGQIHLLYGSASGMVDGDWWNQSRGSVPGAPQGGDHFGAALWMDDFNGDGRDDLAIGVPNETISGIAEVGQVQIFNGAAGGFTVGSVFSRGVAGIPGSIAFQQHFGSALGSGDFDHDGYADLAVGVPDDGGGAVNVIYGAAGGLGVADAQLFSWAEAGSRFGTALAGGDFDGDGTDDLAIGMPGHANGAIPSQGGVFIATGSITQCADGLDNDGDGLVDLDDPHCGGYSETLWEHELECTNFVDDDGDGYTDTYPPSPDPGCFAPYDLSEQDPGYPCDDGVDNDGDGFVDTQDPGCYSPNDTIDGEYDYLVACDNSLDDDGDGLADWQDPGCSGVTDGSEHEATLVCDDGLDNDGDGFVDHPADPGCGSLTGPREQPQCQDGIDNDGQLGIDFDGGASLNDGVPIAEPDPECTSASKNREAVAAPGGCGLGPELALLLPILAALRGRRALP